MDSAFLPFLMFVPFFIILLVVGLGRRDCPDCGRKLELFQSPGTKTWRMWMDGGYLCSNCGCETTLAGEKVALGTGPRSGSVARGMVLLAPLIVGGILLVVILASSRPAVAPPVVAAPVVMEQPAAVPDR